MNLRAWWVLGALVLAACGTGGTGGSGGSGGGSAGGGSGGGTAGGAGGGAAGGIGGGAAGGAGGGTAGGSGGGAAGGAGGGAAGGAGGGGGGAAGGSGGGGGTAGGVGGGAAACGTSSLDSGCTGFPPLNEPDAGTYKGFSLGLYPNGNQIPVAHRTEGIARANQIGADGGTFILISIGYSNATQEFCQQNGTSGPPSACSPWTFMGQINLDPEVRKTGLVVFNGAAGSQTNATWDEPTDPNYARVAANLADAGYAPAQVQVGWVKIANPQPSVSLPAANADAIQLERSTANIVRAMKVNYPDLKMVFISSRTYGGWATTALNPEPYAYEGGFAVKWVVEDQIRQMQGAGPTPDGGNLDYTTAVAPWIAWGPYLWTDGLLGRKSDNLVWRQNDTENDGTHPSQSGETKVGNELRQFFKNNQFTRCWFTVDGGTCP